MTHTLSKQIYPGQILAQKYEVVSHVGSADEGELYMLEERETGIERTAKFFNPATNKGNRNAKYLARKLHKLRHCNVLMQYRTQETIEVNKTPVTFMVSDFREGEPLRDFLASHAGKKLTVFEGLHLLHAIAVGVEPMHRMNEYHGNVEIDNILIRRRGISYQIKLMDLHNNGASRPELIKNDIIDMIRILYNALGGSKTYSKHPQVIKDIMCGLRKSLIKERFKNAGTLRAHLESIHWN